MTLRIGAGAGFAGDRIDPAVDLARHGRLDFLAFECLAERTLAYGHLARMADPQKGYDPRIEGAREAGMHAVHVREPADVRSAVEPFLVAPAA